MKTYLIIVPQYRPEENTLAKTAKEENMRTAERFQDVLFRLHESLGGRSVAFEIVVFGQNMGLCFSGYEATCEVVTGQIYAMDPLADIIEIPDFTRKITRRNMKFA